MTKYMLPLSDLHAAAPGVLDVVFGPDGDFEGSPLWLGPIQAAGRTRYLCPFPWSATHLAASAVGPDWVAVAINGSIGERWEHAGVALDLRVASVASRIAGLCYRSMLVNHTDPDDTTLDVFRRAIEATSRRWRWKDGHAAFLASLTVDLAPQIAALKGRP